MFRGSFCWVVHYFFVLVVYQKGTDARSAPHPACRVSCCVYVLGRSCEQERKSDDERRVYRKVHAGSIRMNADQFEVFVNFV
jgi:hypothetical protein